MLHSSYGARALFHGEKEQIMAVKTVAEGAAELLERIAFYEWTATQALDRGDMKSFHYWAALYHRAVGNDEQPVGWIE